MDEDIGYYDIPNLESKSCFGTVIPPVPIIKYTQVDVIDSIISSIYIYVYMYFLCI